MKYFLLSMLVFFGVQVTTLAASGKIIQETVEAAAKVSGRKLSALSRKSASAALKKLVAQYGDDALKIVRTGGLETLQLSSKYGDEFWKLAKTANPAALRSLVLHADDLMPAARRLGKDFLTLEGKVPGLGIKVVNEFGDDAAIMLARQAPPEDISKLLGCAARADSPATKKALLEAYRKGGSKFLKHLNWKHIMATGLSTAAVVSAYKLSDGVEEGLKTTAKEHPETFKEIINSMTAPIRFGLFALIALIVAVLGNWIYKIGKKFLTEKQEDSDAE